MEKERLVTSLELALHLLECLAELNREKPARRVEVATFERVIGSIRASKRTNPMDALEEALIEIAREDGKVSPGEAESIQNAGILAGLTLIQQKLQAVAGAG